MRRSTRTGSAYERALAHPRFLAAVRAAYDGPHDVLDALWWLEHPLQPGPSGAIAPAMEVAVAQRSLYARSGTEAAHTRYREATERELASRSAIAAALLHASPRAAVAPPPSRYLAAPADPAPTRGARMVGLPEHVFGRASGPQRIAPLLRIPRATLYAVDSVLGWVCVVLVADEDSREFRGETVDAASFGRDGIVLEVDRRLALQVGLERAEWLPTGEVRWWSPDDMRFAGPELAGAQSAAAPG